MHLIKNIISPRKEVLEGVFQGVIQTHKVDAKESRIENNPEEFLKVTYPSSAIKRSLERIEEKISGTGNQGGFLVVGPYGSGKSHCLITLYHLFNHPSLAREWSKKWNIKLTLPQKSKSVIISTRRYDVDYLWVPVFELLGRKDLLEDIKRFPTVDQIEELIGEGVVAIFIDEIENWYGSFDPKKQAHIIEQNETFLEHLLEVASDPNKNLFVFITFLEEKEGLKKIFNRTKPIRIDVSSIEDREKVVLHRLFEDIESIDIAKVEKIVENYVKSYTEPIRIENTHQYKNRMIRTYPFHPLLFDTLIQIYEAAAERQDVRGMLNVLADAVRDNYDKKDLILLSDIDENAFRGIDLRLVEKYEFDLQRVKDIPFHKEILKTVLIFTLNEKTHGATESDILLAIYSPSQGHTLNSLVRDLDNVYGRPHYLHKEDGVYIFRHDVNLFALLEKEKAKIDDRDVKNKIAEIVKKNIFENKVFIHDFDQIPDDSKVKIVVSLESWGTNDQLKAKLNDFYKGKEWQNTYIPILPLKTVFTFEISEKVKNLVAAEKLKEQIKDEEGKLKKIIQEEVESVADRLRSLYGYMIKWTERAGELTFRPINISPDVAIIREKAGSDVSLCADFIAEQVKDKPDGVRIENLINDFKKFRKFPFILDEEVIYTAIRNLHRDKKIIIQGERAKWYIDESPRYLEPAYVIFDPKYAPPSVTKEVEIPGEQPTEEPTEGPEEPLTERKERKVLNLTGNSPRVILSQVEARTSESDLFEKLTITYKFGQDIYKHDIMKFLKQLPHQEDSEIEAEVILWREKDEG